MPDRHSSPARPRPTQSPTTPSHGSPAPTVTSVSPPSVVSVRPRTSTCTTRPSNPPSATTRLLPPPITNSGTAADSLHRWARLTSSMVLACRSHRASPPIPSVVSAASGSDPRTSRRGSVKGKEPGFLGDQRRERLRSGTYAELDPIARRQLRRQRHIGGDHNGKLWVPAGCLMVGHEQNRLSRGWHLNRAGEGCIRDHLLFDEAWNPSALQAIPHAIGLRRDNEARSLERVECVRGKILVLRAWQHPHADAAAAHVRGRVRHRATTTEGWPRPAKGEPIALHQRAAVPATHP